ncbi:hypothetical protein B0H14DRAFT_3616679 [Mycena olivaceomarginata]|nr:hypothetical protein B0H14DRAFT_3616679 [Mycena olivaceomarginata]
MAECLDASQRVGPRRTVRRRTSPPSRPARLTAAERQRSAAAAAAQSAHSPAQARHCWAAAAGVSGRIERELPPYHPADGSASGSSSSAGTPPRAAKTSATQQQIQTPSQPPRQIFMRRVQAVIHIKEEEGDDEEPRQLDDLEDERTASSALVVPNGVDSPRSSRLYLCTLGHTPFVFGAPPPPDPSYYTCALHPLPPRSHTPSSRPPTPCTPPSPRPHTLHLGATPPSSRPPRCNSTSISTSRARMAPRSHVLRAVPPPVDDAAAIGLALALRCVFVFVIDHSLSLFLDSYLPHHLIIFTHHPPLHHTSHQTHILVFQNHAVLKLKRLAGPGVPPFSPEVSAARWGPLIGAAREMATPFAAPAETSRLTQSQFFRTDGSFRQHPNVGPDREDRQSFCAAGGFRGGGFRDANRGFRADGGAGGGAGAGIFRDRDREREGGAAAANANANTHSGGRQDSFRGVG